MKNSGSNSTPRTTINPPPADMRCQGCRKHIDELEAFKNLREVAEIDAALGLEYIEDKLALVPRVLYGDYSESWECRECADLEDAEVCIARHGSEDLLWRMLRVEYPEYYERLLRGECDAIR